MFKRELFNEDHEAFRSMVRCFIDDRTPSRGLGKRRRRPAKLDFEAWKSKQGAR